jgi:hypothetical protein
MINETKLRETLVTLAMQLKENHIATFSALGELASLREAVRGLDPTFQEVIEKTRKETRQKIGAEFQSHLQAYDSLIQRLKDGQVC